MKIRILGSGSSAGTPVVGGDWGNCDPENPKNRRSRPSILVREAGRNILVDTSPDLRQQLLEAEVSTIDALLYTHAHADHLHGIDDMRAVNRVMDAWIDAYADEATWEHIDGRFGYATIPLRPEAKGFFYKPCLTRHDITVGERFDAAGISILPFHQDHGRSKTVGYRIGDFGYSTDVKSLPEESFAALEGVEVWVVGTLQPGPYPTHAHVDLALEWIERVGPRLAVLTHLSNQIDYASLSARLPDGVIVAYDGLEIAL